MLLNIGDRGIEGMRKGALFIDIMWYARLKWLLIQKLTPLVSDSCD